MNNGSYSLLWRGLNVTDTKRGVKSKCRVLLGFLCAISAGSNAASKQRFKKKKCSSCVLTIYDHKNTSNNLIQLQYLTLGESEENGTTSMVTEPSTVSPYNCCPIYLNPNIMVSTSTGNNRQ